MLTSHDVEKIISKFCWLMDDKELVSSLSVVVENRLRDARDIDFRMVFRMRNGSLDILVSSEICEIGVIFKSKLFPKTRFGYLGMAVAAGYDVVDGEFVMDHGSTSLMASLDRVSDIIKFHARGLLAGDKIASEKVKLVADRLQAEYRKRMGS